LLDADAAQQVIPANQALLVALENIPKIILGRSFAITDIDLFYHGPATDQDVQEPTPAWGFEVAGQFRVYVDAFTGEFLR
jgi:hypothetical protein